LILSEGTNLQGLEESGYLRPAWNRIGILSVYASWVRIPHP